eukprot:15329695-Ditylum_brightwellii.AAC.1
MAVNRHSKYVHCICGSMIRQPWRVKFCYLAKGKVKPQVLGQKVDAKMQSKSRTKAKSHTNSKSQT